MNPSGQTGRVGSGMDWETFLTGADSGHEDRRVEILRAVLTAMIGRSASFAIRSALLETAFLDLGNETLMQTSLQERTLDSCAHMRSEDGKGLGRSSVVFGGLMDKSSDATLPTVREEPLSHST